MNVPLSVLDLSPVSEGADATTALRNSIDLAQHAEQWGYRRYWLAEHHFVAVASTVPALVIAHIAAATHRIRVGAGAVQIASTTPAAVVESFGILDALYPGRIDLGLRPHRTSHQGPAGRQRAEARTRARPRGRRIVHPAGAHRVRHQGQPQAARHRRRAAAARRTCGGLRPAGRRHSGIPGRQLCQPGRRCAAHTPG